MPDRSPVTIRAAEPADAGAIAAVHIRTWQVAYAHIFPAEGLAGLARGLDRRANYWGEVLNSRNRRSDTLVAEDGGDIIGFADVGPTRDEELDVDRVGELNAIYVLPDQWGRGVGQALMEEVFEKLRAARFDEAMLWVLEDNPRTRRFYEAAGWEHDGAVKDDTFLDTAVRENPLSSRPASTLTVRVELLADHPESCCLVCFRRLRTSLK